MQASKIFRILKILSIIQLIYGIFWMFFSLKEGFTTLLGALLLYLIVCGRNWCTAVFYIICYSIEYITTLVEVFMLLNDNPYIPLDFVAVYLLFMLKIPFYTLTIYYSFLAYRELKALSIENQFGGAVQPWEQAPSQSFQPYSGQGYNLR
jgi:hypothetical protein